MKLIEGVGLLFLLGPLRKGMPLLHPRLEKVCLYLTPPLKKVSLCLTPPLKKGGLGGFIKLSTQFHFTARFKNLIQTPDQRVNLLTGNYQRRDKPQDVLLGAVDQKSFFHAGIHYRRALN